MKVTRTILLMAALAAPAGCQKQAAAPPPTEKARAVKAPPAAEAKKAPAPAAGKVARIVFVDKEKACKCTMDRVDASWKALTEVVGFPPVPDVERIHMDTQEGKAAPYRARKAIMVPPAIYFMGKGGKLVEVLQGEVKAEQIRALLR